MITAKEQTLISHIEKLQSTLQLVGSMVEDQHVKSLVEEITINSQNIVKMAKEEVIS